MPTPEEVAAEVRRRPVGAMIAAISRDFGIVASHPLWPELQLAVAGHDGNLGDLTTDMLERTLGRAAMERRIFRLAEVPRAVADAMWLAPLVPSLAPRGTGPP
jgi:hypothetical protein